METIQEIASVLRSTEKMATAFAGGVREKLGRDVPDSLLLEVLRKLNPRTIEINKVADAVRNELSKARRRSTRPARASITRATVSAVARGSKTRMPSDGAGSSRGAASVPKTLAQQLDELLGANWSRAEREGFRPQRMNGDEFVDAVHRHSDPRDATRRRILRACKRIDDQDVLITPTIVADAIREEG